MVFEVRGSSVIFAGKSKDVVLVSNYIIQILKYRLLYIARGKNCHEKGKKFIEILNG